MSKQILSDLDFTSASRLLNLLDPVAAQEPATKAYVDNAVEGLAWKDSCRVATVSNLNLAAPGAKLSEPTPPLPNERRPLRRCRQQRRTSLWRLLRASSATSGLHRKPALRTSNRPSVRRPTHGETLVPCSCAAVSGSRPLE